MDYIFLLSISFLAATILPMASEVAVFDALRQGLPAISIITVATLGNTAGACINWLLGRYLLKFKNKPWFYFSPQAISKAQLRFNKYGLWTLLFSWLPIIGDPLTLIAGTLKVKFIPFVLLVAAGKAMRYALVLSLLQQTL